MAKRKSKADINRDLFKRANNARRVKWQSIAQQCYDFYLNDQLTKEELEELRNSGMPDFIINRITPIIDVMKYFVTTNNPRWQAVGVEGSDTDIAHIHSAIAEYCWYLSNGRSMYSQIVNDALIKGLGYFFVDVDSDADMGKGEVVFRRIDPFDVYVDTASRDFLFRDASYIIVKKNLTKTQLKEMFPQFKRKIAAASGDESHTWQDYSVRDSADSDSFQPMESLSDVYTPKGDEDEIIDFYERYYKKKVSFVNVYIKIPPPPEIVRQMKEQVSEKINDLKKEVEVGLKEKYIQLANAVESGDIIQERADLEMEKAQKMAQAAIEEKSAVLEAEAMDSISKVEQKVMLESEFNILMENEEASKNIVDYVQYFETRIEVICTAGDKHLYTYELPYTNYPIIPICYTYTGTPYPMSAVTPLIGKQRELNKSHQLMLHNANLGSNLRWMYEEGSVPEEEWEEYSSAPGALLKYRQGFAPPTPIHPLPVNQAFASITQESRIDFEYISGISASMQGTAGGEQHETYRGMLALDEYGTRRIKAWMQTMVEPALEHLGEIFKQVAQSTYRAHKVFRIVQPEAGSMEAQNNVEVNIPIYNDFGDVVSRWNDYASNKFDIKMVAGATAPVNRWALLDEYFRWFQAGLIDDIAMIAETDIRDKKSIVKRKSLYAQLQGQLQQLQEALKDKDGTIETLERQLVQAGIKDKVRDAGNQVDKEVLETQAKQKLLRNVMKNEVQAATDQMRKNAAEEK
jgi:hypothetical protein|tara:strand:+ start:1061 stop:3295 length:2235 start_codon:yes stop_codon:yes gene_type:complete